MTLKNFLFPYWLIFAVLLGRAIYIQKFIIIPTLKKYGGDFEDYWSFKKQKKQLEEYIEVCKAHALPDKHWRYMKLFNKIGFVFVLGWIVLLFASEQ